MGTIMTSSGLCSDDGRSSASSGRPRQMSSHPCIAEPGVQVLDQV